MDPYVKTVYANDSAPAISAANLNKSEDELEKLDIGQDSVANPQIFMPLAFNGNGGVYSGSNSFTEKTMNKGYAIDEISKVDSGSSSNYGIGKEIVDSNMRPAALLSGTTMKILVYAELADNVSVVTIRRMVLGASYHWTDTYAIKNSFTLTNGSNVVELEFGAYSGTYPTYSKFVVTCSSRAELQKIKRLYVFPNATISDLFLNSITGSALSAGWENADDKLNRFIGISGTASSGGMEWSEDGTKHILDISNGTTSSGQYYGLISYDIKPLFGKGYKLQVEITNQNGNTNGYYFSMWKLSQSAYSWSASVLITDLNPTDYGASLSASESVFEIDIDSDFSAITPSSYSNINLIVSAYRNKPTNVGANKLSITIRVVDKNNYVIADILKNFDQSNYYTKAQIDDMIKTSETDMLFWGDSLTAGSGGGGTTYPDVCAAELGGKVIQNCGVGGESANTIAARQGGNNIIIPAGNINGNYPYTQFIDIFGGLVNPLRQGGDGATKGSKYIYINDEKCTLTITQTSSISEDAVYTISGYTGGASDVPLLGRFEGSEYTGKVIVIFVGQNGQTVGSDTTYNARITIIDSMISHIGHEKYVILGRSTGTDANRAEEDLALLNHYGNKFFPTRKMLVENGLTINGLTPTAQDTTDISNGTVPESLRDDSVHLNAYGYTALGKLLADKIRSLGYFME